MKYNQDSKELPKWVQLMYSENLMKEIDKRNTINFIQKNEFVKNQHTQ